MQVGQRDDKNAGGAPIEKSDFEESLWVEFINADAVLAVHVAEMNPPELRPQFRGNPDMSKNAETILVDPLLLNPGDQFALLALVSGFNGEVKLTGRVKG